MIGGHPVLAKASIGLASSRDAGDGADLVRNADLAMYAAKGSGKGRIDVYHPGMHEALLARVELEADLRKALEGALEGSQFHLLYQPKVSLETRRITGVEALVRWQHPERGMVPPLQFIPLAEETGLIVPIGAWILEEACRQSARWKASFPDAPPLEVSVNLSARQFEHGLVQTVRQALSDTGIDPGMLCLELTESMLMDDVELAVVTLQALKGLGVKISVDDFGTGYSSLTYLKQFPLDELKVDKSFVDGVAHQAEDGAIVAAIIGMAHALDLAVVGEGVETEAQAASLEALGCESAQGFYFSRPQPVIGIDELLAKAEGRSVSHVRHTSPIAAGRLSVLVVDDAPEIRAVARASLTPAGFVVHEAANGEEALARVASVQPDCVLLDLNMPGMSGLELCRALRAQPSAAQCTLIMLTSSDRGADKVDAFSLGADDYVVKPLVPRDLASRVGSAIRRRKETVAAETGRSPAATASLD